MSAILAFFWSLPCFLRFIPASFQLLDHSIIIWFMSSNAGIRQGGKKRDRKKAALMSSTEQGMGCKIEPC